MNSISFSRALRIGIAVTLPAVIGIQFGYSEIGLVFSFGAFWSSPSDIIGSFQHKKIGILISATFAMIISFIKGYLYFEAWLLVPVLGLLTFAISFISIYGFRASLVSFSGLIALVLSSAHNSVELEIYQYALLVGLGGLWYLLLTKVWYRLNPKAESEEFLSETYFLTADFLETRGKLIDPNLNHEKLQSELIDLQSELTANHETLREILTQSRRTSGWSSYQNTRLLIFVQLVEILENAIANPGNYSRMDKLFNQHPQFINKFQGLIFEMSYQLRMFSIGGTQKSNLHNKNLEQSFEDITLELASLSEELFYQDYLMLQNLLEYQESQYLKLKRIKHLLDDLNTTDIDYIDQKVAKLFLSPQNYEPALLLRNLSFRSTIFRHSFRLAFTVMIGYALGSIFAFQNPYSILLVVIVIMRPSYGLTRNRAKDRMVGTLIGGFIAIVIVFLIQNPYVYGAMGIFSLVIALSLLQKNYKASATFITLSAVFIYAILSPNILDVIKFRILDTLVGAGLSYVAMLFLWPTWEYIEIKDSIGKSVQANMNFLHEIIAFYQQKSNVPTSYNIARKQAFLRTSNLSSAFQRMAQEPRSKQKEIDKIYELVVLNHTFLASLASLSTYIQHNKTTAPSEEFKIATEKIEQNLKKVLHCLEGMKCEDATTSSEHDPLFEKQFTAFNSLGIRGLEFKNKETIRDLQETHLVWKQLQWLFSMSSKMLKIVTSINLS